MPEVTFEFALQQTVRRNISGASGPDYKVVTQRYENGGGGTRNYYDIEQSGNEMNTMEVEESEIFDPSAQ